MEKVICGVDCRIEVDDMNDREVIQYIDIIEREHKQKPTQLVITMDDGDNVNLDYTIAGEKVRAHPPYHWLSGGHHRQI